MEYGPFSEVDEHPVHVLLVENSLADYQRICDCLDEVQGSRFVVEWVRDSESAAAASAEGRFDVCLIGSGWPEQASLAFLKLAPLKGSHAPILLLEGTRPRDFDHQALALGAAGFIAIDYLEPDLVARSITFAIARQKTIARLASLAQHDALTRLPNRSLFHDRLTQALAGAKERHSLTLLAVLNLNRFAEINERHGCLAGDLVLQSLARRMLDHLRAVDTVARIGGDEFAIVLEDIGSPARAALILQNVMNRIAAPVALEHGSVSVTASGGAVLCPHDGEDANALLRNAYRAMHQAKANQERQLRFHCQAIAQQVSRRLLLGSTLKRAIDRQEMELRFHPQIHFDRRPMSVACALGWARPELATIEPKKLRALAAERGLTPALAEWLIHAALEQLGRWTSLGLTEVAISTPMLVELVSQRHEPAGWIKQGLQSFQIAPDRFELDLMHGLARSCLSGETSPLRAFKQLGIRLALDGFGEDGMPWLQLPAGLIDAIKLTPRLYRDLPGVARQEALVEGIIELARRLGLDVLAKGVENQRQLDFLRASGCCGFQLLTHCPPLTADSCTSWLLELQAPEDVSAPAPKRSRRSSFKNPLLPLPAIDDASLPRYASQRTG